jgi:hypothetical protein
MTHYKSIPVRVAHEAGFFALQVCPMIHDSELTRQPPPYACFAQQILLLGGWFELKHPLFRRLVCWGFC